MSLDMDMDVAMAAVSMTVTNSMMTTTIRLIRRNPGMNKSIVHSGA